MMGKSLHRSFLDVIPLRTPGWLLHNGVCQTSKEARETAPYKVGDVVWFNDDVVAREALIVQVRAEWMEFSGEWIQKYRVRIRKKNGEFGTGFRWIYPGWIEKGYE